MTGTMRCNVLLYGAKYRAEYRRCASCNSNCDSCTVRSNDWHGTVRLVNDAMTSCMGDVPCNVPCRIPRRVPCRATDVHWHRAVWHPPALHASMWCDGQSTGAAGLRAVRLQMFTGAACPRRRRFSVDCSAVNSSMQARWLTVPRVTVLLERRWTRGQPAIAFEKR